MIEASLDGHVGSENGVNGGMYCLLEVNDDDRRICGDTLGNEAQKSLVCCLRLSLQESKEQWALACSNLC